VELPVPGELVARFPPTRRYLIGVSGGRDSIALLHGLKERGYARLLVCHLDHQLRGRASQADARFVEQLARRLELDFVTEKTDVAALARRSKQSIETAGRNARYDFFARVARRRRCRTIFLGHHADDLVETFLLNLFRGAGATGLSAMRPVTTRPVSGVALTIVRPLLGMARGEIDSYVRKRGLKYRDDLSNDSAGPMRNRVRHRIIPYIEKQLGRKVSPALWRAAMIAGDEAEWADALVDWSATLARDLPVKKLREQPRALQRRTIQRWLQANGVADLDFDTIELVRGLIEPNAGRAKANLPRDRHARRRAGKLFLEEPHGIGGLA
jgi:tRNA(Ile)-lysidine synthase